MAKQAPWFKFWAEKFLADNDVIGMTAEQVGWYCLMLIMSWTNTPRGYITSDQQVLSRCCRCVDPVLWSCSSEIVLKKFQKTEDGLWYYHPRMLEQADDLAQLSEKKSKAGKASADKRAQQVSNKRSTGVEQVLTEGRRKKEEVNTPPTPSTKSEPQTLDAPAVARAVCVECGLSGEKYHWQVRDVIDGVSRRSKLNPEQIAERVMADIREFQAGPTSQFGVKWFLGEYVSRWQDPTSEPAVKYETEADEQARWDRLRKIADQAVAAKKAGKA